MKLMANHKSAYLKKLSFIVVRLAPKYDFSKIGVFGSLVKKGFKKGSDIDILITFKSPVGFITFIKLENELSDFLGRRVDLVTESSLSPYFRNEVLKELKVIYEEK